MTGASLTDKPERYWLTKTFAVSLTVVVALYGAWGWLQVDQVFKAVICLVAQGLANGCAVLARRSLEKGRPALAAAMIVPTLGCAFWSGEGLHHAWTLDGSEIDLFWVVFIAALEPLMFWGVEEVQSSRPKAAAKTDVTSGAGDGRKRRDLNLLQAGAAGVALMASPAMAAESAPAPQPRTAPATPRTPQAAPAPTLEARTHARQLIEEGWSASPVSKMYPEIPVATIRRWRQEKLKRASIPLAEAA